MNEDENVVAAEAAVEPVAEVAAEAPVEAVAAPEVAEAPVAEVATEASPETPVEATA